MLYSPRVMDTLGQPSEKSDYTLSVMLDDDRQDGAEWYEVQLRW